MCSRRGWLQRYSNDQTPRSVTLTRRAISCRRRELPMPGNKPKPLRERFDAKWEEDASTGCWLWTGATTNSGYGSLWVHDGIHRKKVGAHRIAYEAVHGPIPPKLTVDHKCKVKRCVNPAHLRLLTHRENILLSETSIVATNMAKVSAPCGHPYTVRWGNALRCLPCTQVYMHNWRAKRGAS